MQSIKSGPLTAFSSATIGDEATYNLDFKLPCLPNLIQLPIGARDNEDVSTTPTMRSKATWREPTCLRTLALGFRAQNLYAAQGI